MGVCCIVNFINCLNSGINCGVEVNCCICFIKVIIDCIWYFNNWNIIFCCKNFCFGEGIIFVDGYVGVYIKSKKRFISLFMFFWSYEVFVLCSF